MSNLENEQSKTLLEFCGVRKLYGLTIANDDLSFAVRQGSIHAIIGENGAGKTTAMKILFGLERPTSGQILFKGKPRPWTDARGALDCGIGMVHQHFMLSGRHTALENVILGQENLGGAKRQTGKKRWRFFGLSTIDREAARNKLESLAKSVGFRIPWEKLVDEIPVGVQQQLEIMKLLNAEVDTMIFDEPTAVLSPLEKEKFLEMLLGLRAEGKTIVLITHKLQEVKKIADVVTVFRRGKSIATRNNSDLTIQDMADLMVGRKVSMGELPRAQEMNGESLLSLSSFSAASVGGHRLLRDVELSISSGEIVGIAGVEGSGQKEIWDYICGPKDYVANKKIVSGDFKIFGKSGLNYSRGDVRKQPVAIVPADRLKNAVMASQNLLENDLLGHDQDFFTAKSPFGRWIDRTAALRRLGPVLKDFDVRPPSPWSKIEGMSGGNQQKFVIGREFSRQPRLIFCAEPTRGVDVGSIERIHLEILKYRDQGAGVLLISSQLEELMALSDRILVMFEGAIIQIFGRGSFSESEIGRAIGGVRL